MNDIREFFSKFSPASFKNQKNDSIRNFQPPITGEIVMEHYKIKPCKEIGIIKEKIKNAILDGEIQNDYNEAFELMIKIGKSLGLKDE